MELEVKYYYNYFLLQEDITFDDFIEILAGDLAESIPGLQFNMAWVRQCDALNSIRSARNSLDKLRAYVHENQRYSVSFWDILWKLKEVSVGSLGVTYVEIGTTRREIDGLAWAFLLKEGQDRVKDLRDKLRCPNSYEARRAFVLVDNMLGGSPVPREIFCTNRRTHYSIFGPYQLYYAFAKGRVIPPDDVGWSLAEHRACRKLVFPDGYHEEVPTSDWADPTAPATIELDKRYWVPLTATPGQEFARKIRRLGKDALQEAVCPAIWSKVVELTMRKIPQLPQRTSHPH